MNNILKFSNIQYFPILIVSLIYLPQSFLGMAFFEFDYSFKVLLIGTVSCFIYYVLYKYVYSTQIFRLLVNRKSRFHINSITFATATFSVFILITVYAAYTTEQIALFAVFQGASIDDLAKSRGDFLSARNGWEVVISYLHVMLKMAFLPYAIAILFYIKHKLRFYFLGIFLFLLALTLEKSMAIVALMPIIILSINSNAKRNALRPIIALILFIGLVAFLSRGGLSDLMEGGDKVDESGAGYIPPEYQLFKGNTQDIYIMNRVVWIPFATAVDWLKYQDEVLKSDYSMGTSIALVAAMLDVPKNNLEKEVFSFQWGQNEQETGRSNTAYFIDAFVNFSWFGVFFYAAILAAIVKMFNVSDNIPAKCTVYVSLFYLSFNSLPPMLFSGGLMAIVFFALFIQPPALKLARPRS